MDPSGRVVTSPTTGEVELRLFNIVGNSYESMYFPHGRISCRMSEFSQAANHDSIWKSFNTKAANWKYITRILATECPASYDSTSRMERIITQTCNDSSSGNSSMSTSRVTPNVPRGKGSGLGGRIVSGISEFEEGAVEGGNEVPDMEEK